MSSICRWVPDDDVPGGRFLVPGCWSRALNEDADCQCPRPPTYLPPEARALLEALAALRLDKEQLEAGWSYLKRVQAAGPFAATDEE